MAGVWTGSEKDQQIDGLSKSWEMTRMDDGTYTINFKFTQGEMTDSSQAVGDWWTENGKYYEFHDYDGKTDVYSYTVLDPKRVKFKSEKIAIGMENSEYEFIDTKTGNAKKETITEKDGSSYENAIKIGSVPQEYQYVRANCTGCILKSQSLSVNKGRFYDIIIVTKPDGSTKSYYFDITSFYGKGF
ncbi:hypothetical protein MTP09_12490 [Chryseobacterium suipulveris]|uniref:Lipocalin-like domain-containing protein n=1 Tax=Chryseobacterium suipulveris TaxID=2929800 RepID=A0ABY4BNP2_9FLAO|nr:hypothetical protein [Chryseobacterium suipulveris]UOE40710.1 hypothetical protein MTP09_12490 [Chryseobacterium suipulveris]